VDQDIITQQTRDEHLAAALADLGRSMARRSETDEGIEHEWAERAIELAINHPDPFLRSKLAQIGSLRQVKALAEDAHTGVRVSCADNKFIIDESLQMLLAKDDDAVVVHALLDAVTPYMSVARLLVVSPHRSVRFRLVFQNLAAELLQVLADDSDRRISEVAHQRLVVRKGRVAQRSKS